MCNKEELMKFGNTWQKEGDGKMSSVWSLGVLLVLLWKTDK